MKHVNDTFDSHRVDSSKGVAVEIRHDLQNAGALETLQRFGVGMFAALLSGSKRETDAIFDPIGEFYLWFSFLTLGLAHLQPKGIAMRTIALALAALLAFASAGNAATKRKTKPPSETTTQTQATKPATNTYGPGCKNQGASIMSGGCVN